MTFAQLAGRELSCPTRCGSKKFIVIGHENKPIRREIHHSANGFQVLFNAEEPFGQLRCAKCQSTAAVERFFTAKT